MKRLLVIVALLFSANVFAQSNPGLVYGQVPTAAQWNSFFAAKQDYAGGGGVVGTVTHTCGALVSGALMLGNGGADICPLGSLGTTSQVLIGNVSGPPSFGLVPAAALPASVASLTAVGQVVSGGATFIPGNLGTISSGTTTINCGTVALQYFTNNGASTIAAPAADSSCLVMMTNSGSAGAISFSGFSVGSATGDALTTTNGNKFTISVWRINGTSGYRVAAHQ